MKRTVDTRLNQALGLFADAFRHAQAHLDELEFDAFLSIVTTKVAQENARQMWRDGRDERREK